MGKLLEITRLACSSYEPLLEDYLSGSLSGAASEKTSKHLAGCAACRRALSDAQASVRLMQLGNSAFERASQPSPAFSRTVMARIREQQSAREAVNFWQPFVAMAWKFAATATLALLILLTYARAGKDLPMAELASTVQVDTHDIFSPDPATPPANRDEVVLMVAETNNGN